MPPISKVRTPMRLLAMPRRTPFFGSLCLAKKSLSASASASGSRNSPPTTIPGMSGSRATCSSSALPLFATRAAASCDAPIFRPTRRFAPLLPFSALTFGALGSFTRRCFGSFSGFSFFCFGCFGCFGGFGSFFLPPREMSFFQNGTFSSALGASASATGAGDSTTVVGAGVGGSSTVRASTGGASTGGASSFGGLLNDASRDARRRLSSSSVGPGSIATG